MSLQIEGGTAADQARVQRVVKEAIQRASRQITDGKLRSCVIDKLVHDGTIQIDRDCRRNLLGSNFWLFSFAKIWASDTIHVCLNNIPEDDDD